MEWRFLLPVSLATILWFWGGWWATRDFGRNRNLAGNLKLAAVTGGAIVLSFIGLGIFAFDHGGF